MDCLEIIISADVHGVGFGYVIRKVFLWKEMDFLSKKCPRRKSPNIPSAHPFPFHINSMSKQQIIVQTNIVVAVLDIHMERNEVANWNPRISQRGFVPVKSNVRSAIRSCSREDSTATAIIMEPKKTKFESVK
jgi:hypothetical protein